MRLCRYVVLYSQYVKIRFGSKGFSFGGPVALWHAWTAASVNLFTRAEISDK